MATSKTGSFWLTDTISIAAGAGTGNRVQSTIDLGAYVNVPTGQAVAIDMVDFIYQNGTDYDSNPQGLAAADGTIGIQLTDLNPNTLYVRADDQSLIASGAMAIDQGNNVASHVSDLYPDSYGTISQAFMSVADTLFLVGGWDGAGNVGGAGITISVRIRARIVKLAAKDWQAIAIQSSASN